MTRRNLSLASDCRGTAAIEFAIAGPVVVLLLMGIFQLGILGLAHAGIAQGVESGARYATIYPRPSDSQISAKILAHDYGMAASGITAPTFAHGTTNGSAYVDITMGYTLTLDFGFYRTPGVHLTYTRRAYQV
uniref:TadE/TadG family type IV pilus assembly protein n=1 Tax=Altererythrobacter segetis TaxID=1104773 RepID=UPI00140DE1D9|nr:TadE family protein [Altererythrobacter segetis]